MKLLRRQKEPWLFEISPREKNLLVAVLKNFPMVVPTHHRLSKNGGVSNQAENQRLLEESLQTQKNENRRRLAALLNNAEKFKPCEAGFHFTLTRTEIEWLLQVLNDVRVGSWLALGSPDLELENQVALNEQTLPHLQRMELAGMFEMFFLNAVSGTG